MNRILTEINQKNIKEIISSNYQIAQYIDNVLNLARLEENNLDNDFVLPGRFQIIIDGFKVDMQMSEEILKAIQMIIEIGTNNMEARLSYGEQVNLSDYKYLSL